MINRVLMGAAGLAIFAGVALADTTGNTTPPPPPPPADQQAQADGPPPDDSGWGNWWRHGHRHGDHQGMRDGQDGGRGPMGGPPPMMGPGFHLHLGKDIDVGIMCGTTPFKDCIASAQPLIDAAKAAATAQTPTKTP